MSEEKDGFFITYNITEGPQFSIGKIKFNSDLKEIVPSTFAEFIDLNSGEIYSPDAIRKNISSLENSRVHIIRLPLTLIE